MKPVDAEKNPGLAKLPTKVRNRMGYMKKGGIMKKAKRFERGGDIDDNETEIIFDNRTVKSGKLPSDVDRESKDPAPVTKTAARPKATKLSEPRVDGKTFTETIAKARVKAPAEDKKPEMPKPDPSPGPLGFKGIRNFISGLGKPYGAEKYAKEERMKKGLEGGGMKAGGKVSSASKRADGCAIRGKTRA